VMWMAVDGGVMCVEEPGEALGGVVGRVPGGVPGTSVVDSTSWQHTSLFIPWCKSQVRCRKQLATATCNSCID
jgi:hypothetical protein